MDSRSPMELAVALKDRLDAYVMSPGFRERFTDAVRSALDVLETDRTEHMTAQDLESRAVEIAIDGMLFERPGPGRRTLAERYVDHSGHLTAEERRILDRWRDGGVPGAFEILSVPEPGCRVVARHLANELEYPLVLGDGTAERVPVRMRVGDTLMGRAMPVGDEWLLAGVVSFWPEADRGVVVEAAREVARLHPESVFHNPELLARARELVAAHHETFVGMFRGTVVEGDAEEILESITEFLVAVDFRYDGDWTPARDLMREFDAVRGMTLERPFSGADDDGSAAGSSADGELYRLVHHPVKGLRLLGGDFGLVETMHRSDLPVDGVIANVLRMILERADLPSFVLRDFADRYPQRARELYRKALRRPEFDPVTDLGPLLRDREPGSDPDLPAIGILRPAVADA